MAKSIIIIIMSLIALFLTKVSSQTCDQDPIDLNTASLDELVTLSFIDLINGPQLIEFRPLCSPLDLTEGGDKEFPKITVQRLNDYWNWRSDQSCDETCCKADVVDPVCTSHPTTAITAEKQHILNKPQF